MFNLIGIPEWREVCQKGAAEVKGLAAASKRYNDVVTRFFLPLVLLCASAVAVAQTPRVQPGTPAPQQPPAARPQPGTPAPQQPPPAEKRPPSVPLPGEPQPSDQEPGVRITVPVTNVVAPVTVTDDRGEYVMDLKQEDFRLTDNGVTQRIHVDFAEMPLSIAVVLSVSAKVEPLLPHIKRLGTLLTHLVMGETGEAAVVTFDHRIEVGLPFTQDADRVEKFFKDLKTGGDQARLTDAVVRALTLLRSRPANPPRRKVVLIIAEGRDMGSETDLGFVLSEAQRSSISIYSVGLSGARARLTAAPPNPGPPQFPPGAGPSRPGIPIGSTNTPQGGSLLPLLLEAVRGMKGIFFDNPLEAYAAGTGALHVGGFKEDALQEAVSRVGREIRSQYLLSYSPNNLKDPEFHEIRVSVDRRGVNVRTRPGYYYPGGGSISTPAGPAPPTGGAAASRPGNAQ